MAIDREDMEAGIWIITVHQAGYKNLKPGPSDMLPLARHDPVKVL